MNKTGSVCVCVCVCVVEEHGQLSQCSDKLRNWKDGDLSFDA